MRQSCRFLCVAIGVSAILVGFASCSRDDAGRTSLNEGLEKLRAGLAPGGTAADLQAAAALLKTAAGRIPRSATAFGNLGVACWKLGRLDDAARALRRAALFL